MTVISATPYTNFIGQMVQIDYAIADIIILVDFQYLYILKTKKELVGKRIEIYKDRPSITILENIHTRVILGYKFRYRNLSISLNS